jgi:beta-lactamase class A
MQRFIAETSLEDELRALTADYQGKASLYAVGLHTGQSVALDADTPVPTASTIKLAVLFEALKQIQEGRVHFEDPLTLTPDNQVEGSGVLLFFDTPLTLTLKDALTMMTVVSDNSATNLAIDVLGLENINRRLHWLGLSDTRLYKKVFLPPVPPVPDDQPKFGLGKTTARQMGELMRRFATCNLNAPDVPAEPTQSERALCHVAIGMLEGQSERASIPRYLEGITVANKTGAIDAARSDVGIVYATSGPIVISAYTYENADRRWTVDNAGQVLIARLSKAIVDRWS